MPIDHAVEHVPDEQQRREHVRVDCSHPLLTAPLLETAGIRTTVVGDEDVGFGARGDERGACRWVRDVSRDGFHRDRRLGAESVGRALESDRITTVDDDVHAFAGERLRAREAEAGARRRDDRVPAGNPEIHQKSRSGGGAGPHWLIGSRRLYDPRGHVGRQQVGVGPVLDREAERVLPVVEDLPAQDVATDAPVVAAVGREQVIMPGHEIVEVGDLPGAMTELHRTGLDDQQRVVVGRLVTAIATHEPADGLLGCREIDVVGHEQPECLRVPAGEDGQRRCLRARRGRTALPVTRPGGPVGAHRLARDRRRR